MELLDNDLVNCNNIILTCEDENTENDGNNGAVHLNNFFFRLHLLRSI